MASPPDTVVPSMCFEIEKVIGASVSKGDVRLYQVQWAPTWVTSLNLVGCQHLIDDFFQSQISSNKSDSIIEKDRQGTRSDIEESVPRTAPSSTTTTTETTTTEKTASSSTTTAEVATTGNSIAAVVPGEIPSTGLAIDTLINVKSETIEASDNRMDHMVSDMIAVSEGIENIDAMVGRETFSSQCMFFDHPLDHQNIYTRTHNNEDIEVVSQHIDDRSKLHGTTTDEDHNLNTNSSNNTMRPDSTNSLLSTSRQPTVNLKAARQTNECFRLKVDWECQDVDSQGRRRLSRDTLTRIRHELRRLNTACDLKWFTNRVKKRGSRKKNSPIFFGTLKCKKMTKQTCGVQASVFVSDDDDELFNVTWTGVLEHHWCGGT